ncbi:MAG TPA: zinc-dependent metalloprotease family protein, partial [Vicinamibacterales bacterium]|nr:zinc-dependent metalloprotease family protein [Vicinamibacterales bacterium]
MGASQTSRLPYLTVAVCSILVMSGAGPLDGQTPGQTPGQSEQSSDDIWRVVTERPANASPRTDITGPFAVVRLNKAAFDARISQAPLESEPGRAGIMMTLPLPDGTFAQFRVVESPILAPELAAEFPDIRTYHGQGIDDPTATARLGWTAAGFHAIVLSAAGTVYVDPYAAGDVEYYISFRKQDLQREQFICLVESAERDALERNLNQLPLTHGDTLRTYRLALAATGEYTAAAGGTKALALGRMTTTINRVNGIYERDVAVRLTLITGTPGDATALIYTDGSTDPYTNNDGSVMLGENQTNIDAVVGSANYDIGHVFSTGGGGIAATPSVCALSFKARGVTGLPSPTGDVFDVDFVAHEIGHQFSGDHTFNGTSLNCGGGTRSAANAFEVGSGSTILAYAGICSPEDLQQNSHDYFHRGSLNQITDYIT